MYELTLQFQIKFLFSFAHVLIIVEIHLSSKNKSIKSSASNKGRITWYVIENVGCATSFGRKRQKNAILLSLLLTSTQRSVLLISE